MLTKFLSSLVILLLFVCLLTSCSRLSTCFDKELYKSMKGKGCQDDCPGVTGCNGKMYCNECEANKKGIRIK